MTDLRTKAWFDDMFIYSGGNVYGTLQLKEATDTQSEWSQRYRSNFEYVLGHVDKWRIQIRIEVMSMKPR